MRIHKVINADHVEVFLQQLDNTMRADIPEKKSVNLVSRHIMIIIMCTHPAPPVTRTVLPVPNMSGGVWI